MSNKMTDKQKVENYIRDSFSGTDRVIVKEYVWNLILDYMPRLERRLFDEVFQNLIDEEYIVKIRGSWMWERI